jgi:hypothetical protein
MPRMPTEPVRPGLARKPRDYLDRIVLFLLQVFAEQHSVGVAGPADIDAREGKSVRRECLGPSRVALTFDIALAVGEVFPDDGDRRGLGVDGNPQPRAQARAVLERDPFIFNGADRPLRRQLPGASRLSRGECGDPRTAAPAMAALELARKYRLDSVMDESSERVGDPNSHLARRIQSFVLDQAAAVGVDIGNEWRQDCALVEQVGDIQAGAPGFVSERRAEIRDAVGLRLVAPTWSDSGREERHSGKCRSATRPCRNPARRLRS